MVKRQTTSTISDPMLSRQEVAELYGISVDCLAAWAYKGAPAPGLPYARIGRVARYKRSDVERFVAARTAGSAAEHGAMVATA
jgi:hypothetical protein